MVIAFLSIYLVGLLVLATTSIFMYFDSWYADDKGESKSTLLMRFAFIWPVAILLLVVQILIGVRSKDVR